MPAKSWKCPHSTWAKSYTAQRIHVLDSNNEVVFGMGSETPAASRQADAEPVRDTSGLYIA
ncbi:MAG: hypothetical protein R3E48_05250 [Burkholderiaceae bacterium]